MSVRATGDLGDYLPLKPLDLAILSVLSGGDEYGYQIVKRVADPRAGGLKMSPSNLYHVLDRMIRSGLVVDRGREPRDDGPPRRFYGITPLGRTALSAELARLRTLIDGLGTVGDA